MRTWNTRESSERKRSSFQITRKMIKKKDRHTRNNRERERRRERETSAIKSARYRTVTYRGHLCSLILARSTDESSIYPRHFTVVIEISFYTLYEWDCSSLRSLLPKTCLNTNAQRLLLSYPANVETWRSSMWDQGTREVHHHSINWLILRLLRVDLAERKVAESSPLYETHSCLHENDGAWLVTDRWWRYPPTSGDREMKARAVMKKMICLVAAIDTRYLRGLRGSPFL